MLPKKFRVVVFYVNWRICPIGTWRGRCKSCWASWDYLTWREAQDHADRHAKYCASLILEIAKEKERVKNVG